MKFSPLLLISFFAAASFGDVKGEAASTREIRAGQNALSGELWEIASIHFHNALRDTSLSGEQKSAVEIALTEASVRAGKFQAAWDFLLRIPPSTAGFHFWKGRTLVGLRRVPEGLVELELESALATSELRDEAIFSRVDLLLAQNQPAAALAALAPLLTDDDQETQMDAVAHKVGILFDLGKFSEARAALSSNKTIPKSALAVLTFYDASLLLVENKPDKAASLFAILVSQRRGLSQAQHVAAALGLADALVAQGDSPGAADSLLSYARTHSESTLLDRIFRRLLEQLPAQPAGNDPILVRLAELIPPDGQAPIKISPVNDSVDNRLVAYAQFARATGLRRVGTAEAMAEAMELLDRFRQTYPQHPLSGHALLTLARWKFDEAKSQHDSTKMHQAFANLEILRGDKLSESLRSEVTVLEAEVAYHNDAAGAASRLFTQLATTLTGTAAENARYNALLAKLRNGGTLAVSSNMAQQSDVETTSPDLELERALLENATTSRRAALEKFLEKFPRHPRTAEARLALAECAFDLAPPDISLAKTQLDLVDGFPPPMVNISNERLDFAKLRLADFSRNNAAAIASAQAFLSEHTTAQNSGAVVIILGRNLFQSGSYNDARIVLEKFASGHPHSPLAQPARLLAAQAAALVGTPQSQEEALQIFDQVLAVGGPLVPCASLEKARLMIDSKRIPAAVEFLKKWFSSLAATDPLRLPAGLLLGDAYAQAGDNVDSLTLALGIYDQLLEHAKSQPAIFVRLQYLRGMALQQLPTPDGHGKTREEEAFVIYQSVIESAAHTAPPEWYYFERCAAHALDILEKQQRWVAAINLAKKIAALGGPNAKEVAERARRIQLKNQVWEE